LPSQPQLKLNTGSRVFPAFTDGPSRLTRVVHRKRRVDLRVERVIDPSPRLLQMENTGLTIDRVVTLVRGKVAESRG
jgi:hypothetical protein